MAVKDVLLDLNGGTHALRLDLGAWANLEDQGFDLVNITQDLGDAGSAKRFRALHALLWAMLQHEDDPPSLKDVGRWVDGSNYVEVTTRVGEALQHAFPDQQGNGGPPAAAGTGQSSGGSPSARSGSRRKRSGG